MEEKINELNNLEKNINVDGNEQNNSFFENEVKTSLKDYFAISKNFYAGFWLRFLAFVIDGIVVLSLAKLINTLTFGYFELGYELPVINNTLLYVITYYLYFFLMTYFCSQTIGKILLKIKVEKNDGSKLTLADVFFREVVGRFICNIILIFYLVVPFTSKKKGIHDYIADTVVVKEDFSSLRLKLNTMIKNNKL